MKYLIELGGENTKLGKIEVLELFSNENYKPKLEFEEKNIVVVNLSKRLDNMIVRRLGMTKRISEIIYYSERKNLDQVTKELTRIDIGDKKFAIRLIHGKNESEKDVAIRIGEKVPAKNRIELEKPDAKVLYYSETKTIVSIHYRKFETSYKRCLKHHVKYRPYFSPISIHPRIARAMINLSKSSIEDTIIDPFCGTGGILIEGADIGLKTIGIDIMEKMVENSRGNLQYFGLKSQIAEGDVEKIKDYEFTAIVCDPPYGISSTSKGEDISSLMKRTLSLFSESLESGQRAVIALSNPELGSHKKFKEIHKFKWYIHKSLTRNIIVLEKN